MHDSGPNFPFERDDSYGFLLRRKPSSESLNLIFQASKEERALNDQYSRRAIQKETKKIFSECDYWMRHQRRMERNQRALSSSVSSDPKRSAHPVKSFYWRKRELIGQQILSIQDGLRGSHGDLPSPKSDSWFGEEGTDLFGIEDSSIPRTNLNRGYSSRRQNPFSLVERGVDMIGDKINQLKRNSISAASSPALPLVSTFMVPFARHFDHKPISHMDRNASSTELSSPDLSRSDSDSREVLAKEEEEDDDSGVGVVVVVGEDGTATALIITTVLFTPTAITTCMIDPTNAARVVTAAIKDI
ncbi:hypothetical protein PPACK8108_LOCUS5272 [Phakopsora pachyrhizi]|uniref:Uncharacterized protein n=1 Tax=Phakopsora pachyrhizi TaxID=170000 RepID=A0AAV0AP15_PHAPC|nr:hypothetical protein PPACK8108_LOCUS5272 [Phakopsora pachyrhizi]